MNEGYGNFVEGAGTAVEGDGHAIDLNPIRL